MDQTETWCVVNPQGLYFKSKDLDLLNDFSVMQLTKKKKKKIISDQVFGAKL